MAVTRDKLFDSILNGAAWDAGVVFNRTNGIPIDKFSVFASFEAASTYAATNAVAYPGQVIAVVPEEGEATGYIILVDGTLKEITTASDIQGLEAALGSLETSIKALEAKLFVGTKSEYEAADAKNEIALGAIVIITDDEVVAATSNTAVLGQAKLGTMILGKT